MSFPQDDRLITVNIKMDAFYEPSLTTIGKASAKLPVLTADHMNTIDTLSQFPLANIAQTELPPPLIGPSKTNPFSP